MKVLLEERGGLVRSTSASRESALGVPGCVTDTTSDVGGYTCLERGGGGGGGMGVVTLTYRAPRPSW